MNETLIMATVVMTIMFICMIDDPIANLPENQKPKKPPKRMVPAAFVKSYFVMSNKEEESEVSKEIRAKAEKAMETYVRLLSTGTPEDDDEYFRDLKIQVENFIRRLNSSVAKESYKQFLSTEYAWLERPHLLYTICSNITQHSDSAEFLVHLQVRHFLRSGDFEAPELAREARNVLSEQDPKDSDPMDNCENNINHVVGKAIDIAHLLAFIVEDNRPRDGDSALLHVFPWWIRKRIFSKLFMCEECRAEPSPEVCVYPEPCKIAEKEANNDLFWMYGAEQDIYAPMIELGVL